MAIRLTESRLRQIIREEILSEAGTYFSPAVRRQFNYESNEGNVKARAFQSIYAESIYSNKLSSAIENAWYDIAGKTRKLLDLWVQIVKPIWNLRQSTLKWYGPFGDEEIVHNNMETEIAAWKEWMQQASQLVGRDIVDATMEALTSTNKRKFQKFLDRAESSRSSAADNLGAAEEYDRDLAAKAAAPPAAAPQSRPVATGPKWQSVVNKIIARYNPEDENWMEKIPDRDMVTLSNQLGGIRAPNQQTIQKALVAGGISREEASGLLDSAYSIMY